MANGSDSEHITPDDVVAFLRDWYHLFGLAALMGYMLGVRFIPFDRFRGTEGIRLQATDSFYHWRVTEWTVHNYPNTMPYEPFTGYPSGRFVGQFGTIFDQLIATAAFVLGLGAPSQDDILLAVLIGVPVLAAFVAVPVYLIGARLGGRLGGLAGVAILALAPSEFLVRTTTGMFQHHVAEVLLMGFTVLTLMAALAAVDRLQADSISLRHSDRGALKRPATFAMLSGLVLTLYVLTWPAALLMIGILGAFFVIAITIEHGRGRAPDRIAFVGIVVLGTVAIAGIVLADQRELTTSPTTFSLFQPLLAALGAIGCVGLVMLSRMWNARELSRFSYPVGVASAGILGVTLLFLFLPELFNAIVTNLTGRMIPIDPGVSATTVQEARPPADPHTFMFEQFGFAFFTLVGGLMLLVCRPIFGRPYRPEHTLVVVWSIFLISMTLTQIRFAYYLILPVAVVNAYVVALAIDWAALRPAPSIEDVDGYQLLTIVIVFLVLFMPLMPPLAATTASDVGERAGPSADSIVWSESNEFLASNTPDPGDWGPHGNASQLDYLGVHHHPGNGFDYPIGSYGVMSWWDYGHLITTQAQRIPHSNPFQQNARSSAAYLMADSEERAELVLSAIEATGDGVSNLPDGELQAVKAAADGDSTPTMRYVMIDDAMVGDKFLAKARLADEDSVAYTSTEPFVIEDGEEQLTTWGDAYHETIMARLYLDDGAGTEHYRLVHETADEYAIVGNVLIGEERTQSVRLNNQLGLNIHSWADAREVRTRLDHPTRSNEVVRPLGPRTNVAAYDAEVQPAVKTFERVEGATITGIADENVTDVQVQLQLNATTTDRTFVYTQHVDVGDDPAFSVTVPYPTTDELGVEDGYTTSSVVAVDSYVVITRDESGTPVEYGEVDVPGAAIYQGDVHEVEVSPVDAP